MPRKLTSGVLPLLMLALLPTAGLAERRLPKETPPGWGENDKLPPLERRQPDLDRDPKLIAAAKVAPIPPETLARFIPERLGGFAAEKVAPRVQMIGKALYSEVEAKLAGSRGRAATLLLIDSAGLPPGWGSPILHPPTPGKAKEKRAWGTIEKLVIDGFSALAEDAGKTGVSRLQLELSPRLRLTLEGAQTGAQELLLAARAIDLKALAALAAK